MTINSLTINTQGAYWQQKIIRFPVRADGYIPVRYFGSASAQKCAVQLALDELHNGSRG